MTTKVLFAIYTLLQIIAFIFIISGFILMLGYVFVILLCVLSFLLTCENISM